MPSQPPLHLIVGNTSQVPRIADRAEKLQRLGRVLIQALDHSIAGMGGNDNAVENIGLGLSMCVPNGTPGRDELFTLWLDLASHPAVAAYRRKKRGAKS
jgi:hypothetical protein